MTKRIEPRTLRGFQDVLPTQAMRRARMIRTLEDVFRAHGYGPIDTPALEYAEVLKGKGGEESDREVFEFQDKGGRQVAMRFDLTVPLARFVAEHERELAFPFRRYHVGPVWRGERPQKGRYREFLQCDADLVGATGTAADAEVLVLFQSAYEALGVDVTLRVNDRRILTGLLARWGALDRATPALRALDKRDRQGEETVRRDLLAAGLSDEASAALLEATRPGGDDDETAASLRRALGGEESGVRALDDLLAVRSLFTAAGKPARAFRIDPSIARGLDYYTGIVFEAHLLGETGFGSVGSGGRYDDLAGIFTDTRLPGVGCSVGLTRLLAALEERERDIPPRTAVSLALVAHPGEALLSRAFALAATVRAAGFPAEDYPEAKKHAAQMKYADRQGIRFVLTPDADGSFHGKDMSTGDAFRARGADEAAEALRRRMPVPPAT